MNAVAIRVLVLDKLHEIVWGMDGIAPDFDEEQIHRVRVASKRLRSFLLLYSHYHTGQPISFGKHFRKLYKRAGAVRDIQLALKQLDKVGLDNSEFAAGLHIRLGEAMQLWKENYDRAATLRAVAALYDAGYRDLPGEAVKHFYSRQLRKCSKIVGAPQVSDEDLHDVRIRMKNIINVSKITSPAWYQEAIPTTDGWLKQLDKHAASAGGYNDQRLLLDEMKAFSLESAGELASEQLMPFIVAETKRLADDKDKLCSELRSFFDQ